jgi:4-amino-4-deoxy-L-arabinose transferase-like glycosyltransferase
VGRKEKNRIAEGGARRNQSPENAASAEQLLFGKPTRTILLVILGISIVLRLFYVWTISGTSLMQHHSIMTEADDHAFFEWAQTILAGDWLGKNTYHPYFSWMQARAPLETWYHWWGGKEIFHQSPFYPYFLAVLLGLSNNSIGFVVFVQLLLGALQPLVLYWLGMRFCNERVGLVAAAITAFYGPFIFHQGLLLRDWIPPLLEPLALLLLLRARTLGRGWVMAGASIGLALAAKETALLLLPVTLVWLMFEYWTQRRDMLRVVMLVTAGVVAMLPPYTSETRLSAPPFCPSPTGVPK